MFERMRELCRYCVIAIGKISKECDIREDLVAKMFVKTFLTILKRAYQERNNDKSGDN